MVEARVAAADKRRGAGAAERGRRLDWMAWPRGFYGLIRVPVNLMVVWIQATLIQRTHKVDAVVIDFGDWPEDVPVTVEGGPVEAQEKLRRHLVILRDGYCAVDRAQRTDPELVSFLRGAKRLMPELRAPVESDLRQIAAFYEDRRKTGASARFENTALARFFEAVAQAKARGITDLHIDTEGPVTVIRAREGGWVVDFSEPMPAQNGLLMAGAIFHLNRERGGDTEFRRDKRQETVIVDDRLPSGVERLRYAAGPTDAGHTVALRLQGEQKGADLSLPELGFHPCHVADLETMEEFRQGGILFGAQMGNWKTTVLARMMNDAMHRDFAMGRLRRGISIEDPVERRIFRFQQTGIKKNDDSDYKEALRHVRRMDANIILVSELRDHESALLFLQTSGSGHLTFSTMHAASVFGIVFQLRAWGVEAWQLANPEVLSGLVSQQVVSILCPSCSIPLHEAPARVAELWPEAGGFARLEGLEERLGRWFDQVPLYQGRGREYLDGVRLRRWSSVGPDGGHGMCENPRCRNGVVDRTLIAETLIPDEEILVMLRNEDRREARRHWKERLGGVDMTDHAAEKIIGGFLDPRSVIALARDLLR